MAKSRASADQFAFAFEAPQRATLPAALAGVDARVARTVAEVLRHDDRDRTVIAAEMTVLLAESEDMVTARLVFADLFQKWGIPKGLLSDNGRAFASKWLTGGARTRFRFKIRDEDPLGVLTALGITVHWAKPYRGQSKPIERGFRDFCDAIAKHPAFDGAYTGNTPLAKPEDYGSRAIDIETFWRDFVGAAPVVVAAGADLGTDPAPGTGGADKLSADEIAACALMGVSEEAMLAEKKLQKGAAA
ncbi:transposase domain-containing protein [Sphingobium sp. WTD-1]|uniref:transposase domain-containing protein n=1 Tax=Sphingobium sp. WTD-1 TaxID=2979467 RepID=UPI0024DE3F8A|nr:transposase domain-containing protein [Sphingobium sp. WTD-1]WIA55483.1 transposase domain-containing protein [Sphingobium sp. WTD-1]